MSQEDISMGVEQRLISALAECKDENIRVVILLVYASFKDISHKLDNFISDEQRLKEIVLNGTLDSHDEDHRWINQKRINEDNSSLSKRHISEEVLKTIIIALGSALFAIVAADVAEHFGYVLPMFK